MKTLKLLPDVRGGAVFSTCETWRYSLSRIWDDALPVMTFVGLNPSTATELIDDPTIRRCQQFAIREKCGAYHMLNLFGFRSTDPKALRAAQDPVGPLNDWHIRDVIANSDYVVVAWGAHSHPMMKARAEHVLSLIPNPKCLGTTKGGSPRHPLYVPGNTKLVEYRQK